MSIKWLCFLFIFVGYKSSYLWEAPVMHYATMAVSIGIQNIAEENYRHNGGVAMMYTVATILLGSE